MYEQNESEYPKYSNKGELDSELVGDGAQENSFGSSNSDLGVLSGKPGSQLGSRVLVERDRAHLRASGLGDGTIDALGFWTCGTEEGRSLLGWSEATKGDPAGLVIPYPNTSGYVKVRPHKPRVKPNSENDKLRRLLGDHNSCEPAIIDEFIKYEAPIGSDTQCYIPLAVCEAIEDPATRLYITEGEKKAALMAQEGNACVSVPGVSSAHDVAHREYAQDWGEDEWVLHGQLRPLVTPDREVCVLFDSPDMTDNLNVIRGAVRLARMIQSAGAVALLGYVPMREGMTKGGIDDHFVASSKAGEGRGRNVHRPLRGDFACTRPIGPNEQLDWMVEDAQESGGKIRRELKRQAATWAYVWHENEPKAFAAWTRKAAKRLRSTVEELRGLVGHLVEEGTKPRRPNWERFSERQVLEHCVPALQKHFALFRAPDATERVFSVDERREATHLLGDSLLKQVVHDHLKAKFDDMPPDSILGRAIVLWKKEALLLTEEPQPFCFRGDDRLCFKRFDWEPTQGPFPAWEEFLGRLSDRDAFMAYVWSCFDPKSKSRQYVWLRGEGQDGKSVVLGVMQDIFGNAATGISNTHMNRAHQFVFSAFYGKRVALYADCKNARFGMTEVVRNVTSGDPVLIEFKNKTPFSTPLYVKLFVASNPKPEFTSQNSDRSRVLYIEVAESQRKDDPTWRDRLKQELPGFLWACRQTYDRLCPHHGDIQVSDASKALVSGAAESFEDNWENIFEANFGLDPKARVSALLFATRLRSERLNTHEVADFKTWLERRHGIKQSRDGKGRFYIGIKVLHAVDSYLQ